MLAIFIDNGEVAAALTPPDADSELVRLVRLGIVAEVQPLVVDSGDKLAGLEASDEDVDDDDDENDDVLPACDEICS